MKRTLLLLLGCLFLANLATAQVTILDQPYTTGPFTSGTPTQHQFNAINGGAGAGTTPGNTTVSTAAGAAVFTQTAGTGGTPNPGTGYIARTTDLTTTPTLAAISFSYNQNVNSAQTSKLRFYCGSGMTASNIDENCYARFDIDTRTINAGTQRMTLRKRDGGAATSNQNVTAATTITWILNNTGSAQNYTGPDGTVYAIANDVADLWYGNTRVFNAMAVNQAAQSITDFKIVVTTTGNVAGTYTFDNILIRDLGYLTTTVAGYGPYCAGATGIDVPFTSSSATFNVANIFTVQLSDAAGSFASPTAIGTLTSTATSGTVTGCTIPAAAAAGTGYRIRVVSSSNAFTGTDNGSNITITTATVSTTTTAYGPFCISDLDSTTSFNVGYGSTCSAAFNAGNVFTAQLSNAAGSFAAPITIGTLTSTAGTGSIPCRIPPGIAAGTGYRIRIVSSSPALTAANNNGSNITLTKPTVTIPTFPFQAFSSSGGGATVTATLANGASNYQWAYRMFSGGPITNLAARTASTYTPLGSDFPGRGTYYLVCTSIGCNSAYNAVSGELLLEIDCPSAVNLVTNGDFSAGNTGFTSDYVVYNPGSGGCAAGCIDNTAPYLGSCYCFQKYAVDQIPVKYNNYFCGGNQNGIGAMPASPPTGVAGNMLIGDGSDTQAADLWKQTVTVNPYTDYVFTFWVLSLTGAPGSVQEGKFNFATFADCAQIGSNMDFPAGTGYSCTWYKYSAHWNSANRTSVQLAIRNMSLSGNGNDIAVDDIQFYSCSDGLSYYPPSVKYTWRGSVNTDWTNPDNWGTCTELPTCGDSVVVPAGCPNYPVLTGAQTANTQRLRIKSGASITLNAGATLNICGSLYQNGTLTAAAGSNINFTTLGTDSLVGSLSGSNAMGNVTVNNAAGGTLTLYTNAAASGNLTLTTGTLNLNGYTMQVGGNMTHNAPLSAGTGTIEFYGATNGNYTRTGGTGNFYNLTMNKSSATATVTVGANSNMMIDNTLSLSSGIIVAASGTTQNVTVLNRAEDAIINHSASSYVRGFLRRYINSLGSYDFPVGHATKLYQLANINFYSATTIDNLLASFATYGTLPANPLSGVTECAAIYDQPALDNGKWTISAFNAALTQISGNGQYLATLYNTNYTNNTGMVAWRVMKSENSGGTWSTPTGCIGDVSTPASPSMAFTGFSDFGTGQAATAILPIESLNFTGAPVNNDVRLNWKSMNEINTSYYVLERSATGTGFAPVTTMPATGSPTTTTAYTYLDQPGPYSTLYYRLRIVDTDGGVAHSNTVVVLSENEGLSLKCVPNPVTGGSTLQLHLLLSETQPVQIQVIDITGREIWSSNQMRTIGAQTIDLPTQGWSQGTYCVIAKTNKQSITKRIVVTN